MAVKQTGNRMSLSLRKINRNLGTIPEKTAEFWVRTTPIRSGNARRSTSFNKSNNTIYADYEYAVPLDRGHSKQAPQGMSGPTQRYFERLVRKTVRK